MKVEIEDRSATSAALLACAVRSPTSRRRPPTCTSMAIAWGRRRAVDVVGPRDAVDAARAVARRRRVRGTAARATKRRASRRVCRASASTSTSGRSRRKRSSTSDAVSFTKGCFVGQELVCRIDTRGHVNRFLRRVTRAEASAPAGAETRRRRHASSARSRASPGPTRWRWCGARSNRRPTCSRALATATRSPGPSSQR